MRYVFEVDHTTHERFEKLMKALEFERKKSVFELAIAELYHKCVKNKKSSN